MESNRTRRYGITRTGLVVILAGLVGACAEQSEPAPVFLRGAAEPMAAPMLAPPMPARQVVVQRGQTLAGFAYTYHVSKSAIIAANGLRPPYELKAGSRLVIPGSGVRMASIAAAPVTARAPLPTPRPIPLPPAQATIPQTPPIPQTLMPPPSVTPSVTPTHAQPDVIPLDGPPPKQAVAPPPGTDPSRQGSLETTQGSIGGRFPWPVRGRILASYGNMPGGGHNDGINIAAARGTPVQAIDAGTVAYTGNEVKGYGNIVLIRHANGWISAYAHLDGVTVKPGDTIAAGQIIAKVGDSGSVGEPQLHFELRRGKKPVDPREFLAPAPSAANPAANKAG
jgi:murein DD-endopeptidase MepM/ murein hydrolase activator NlpD